MVRAILGVILGYVVMFTAVFATFSGAYLAMGADAAFKPESYDVTPLWIAVSLVLGLGAALVGGWICAMVSRGGRAPLVLAGVVLVLGLAMAIPVLTGSAPEGPKVRTSDVGNMEAMQQAKQPDWITIVNPLIGAAGVLLGARRRKAAGAAAA